MGSRLVLCRFGLLIVCGGSVAWADVAVTGWKLTDSTMVSAKGEEISRVGFGARAWTEAVVPGTVLTSLVRAGKYPEPLYGLNNLQIPESLCRTSYWYRAEFLTPRSDRQRWLRFDGVNYAGEVWVNGHAAGAVRGAFMRGLVDITPFTKPGERAAVAVLILPPPHPGKPHEQSIAAGTGPNGGAMGADGATFVATVGWDWIPGIRDRDIGLWQGVSVVSAGPVTIHDPFVQTTLPLPRLDSASLAFSATVRNESDIAQRGVLDGMVEGSALSFSIPVELAAHEARSVSAANMTMDKPRLWWPNGYGKQDLYRLTLRFRQGRRASDSNETTFGVRQMGYFRGSDPNLTIQVNDVPIMCRGGNWGLDEAMKRSPKERMDAQLRFHRDANCTMIRNWVGQSTQEDFYSACDKYGLLVWDDFWLANPADGPIPLDNDLFMQNAREKVLRFRNHPSIALWCGRNEALPPPVLNSGLAALVAELDPTRFYQPHSASVNGVSGGGPYRVAMGRYFSFRGAFHTEIGAPSIPTIESIEGMMPKSDWWPINDDWAYHDLTRGAQGGDRYLDELTKRYGTVTGFRDFVRKGAMLTFESYRGMFEGRNSKLFAPASGVLLWMSNPSQPSFVWQLYHYDLDPTAAMFGTKHACERVHIQVSPSGEVQIVNTTTEPLTRLRLVRTTFGENGIASFDDSWPCGAAALAATTIGTQPPAPMVRLRLYEGSRLLSENFYSGPLGGDVPFLDALPRVTLEGHADVRGHSVSVVLKNPTKTVALLVHLSLRRRDGSRVLPAFPSDNYLNVYPGETRTVRIDANGIGDDPVVAVDGWNATVRGRGLVPNEAALPSVREG